MISCWAPISIYDNSHPSTVTVVRGDKCNTSQPNSLIGIFPTNSSANICSVETKRVEQKVGVITPNNALTLSVDLTNSVTVLFDTLALMANTEAKDTSSARTIARQRRAREETAAKREHLLECAKVILRKGSIFELTAISLAHQAGVTRQTVYRYLPNTEAIFKALSDQVITQVYKNLQVPNPSGDTLDHFVTKAIGVFVADSLVIRQLALASALGRASGRWQQVDPESILVQIVSDMPEAKRPVSADPAISARMMITYFRGALYGWAAGFYSDEEFEKQVRLASRLTDPDSN